MYIINSVYGLLVYWIPIGSGYGYEFDPAATKEQAVQFTSEEADDVVHAINGPKNWSWKNSWVTCWKIKKESR